MCYIKLSVRNVPVCHGLTLLSKIILWREYLVVQLTSYRFLQTLPLPATSSRFGLFSSLEQLKPLPELSAKKQKRKICQRNCRSTSNPDVKVIMSSGFSELEVTQKFVGKGGVGWIYSETL